MTTGKSHDGRQYAGNTPVRSCKGGCAQAATSSLKTLVWKTTTAALVAVMGIFAAADTVEWDPDGSGGWGDAARWKGGNAPSSGDTVSFSACTGRVTAADASCLSLIAQATFSSGAGLEFYNTSSEADLQCAAKFTGDGVLIKRGSGTVRLTCVESSAGEAFMVSRGIVVYDGTFVMPRNTSVQCDINRLEVWDPGVFVQAGGSGVSHVYGGLYGDGTISNDVSKTFRVYGGDKDNPPVFSGKFVNKAYFVTYGDSSKAQYLTGTSGSTADNTLILYGSYYTLGLTTFGSATQFPGKGQIQWRGNRNYLLYLGDGETSGTQFSYGPNSRYPTVDAGEHGGLILTGAWGTIATDGKLNTLDLTGCGTNVFGGSLTADAGSTRAIYITKKGPGAWRFTAGQDRDVRGVFETQEGELQFESIAERGMMCSLGDASVLHERVYGTYDAAKALPYAYLLGDGSTGALAPSLATMNYVGSECAEVSSRTIAVRGAARLKSDGALLSWGGITAATAGDHTLVLGGDAAMSKAFSVTNGPGRISLTKEGPGAWTVGGGYDFSGDVAVKGGTLRLAGTNYEWYRLTIMQTWVGVTNAAGEAIAGDGKKFMLKQWALMDENGENQFKGTILHNKAADARPWILQPGEVALGTTTYKYLGTDSGWPERYDVTNLFYESENCFSVQNQTADRSMEYSLDGGVERTNAWVRAIVRLPTNHNPVVRYDLRTVGYLNLATGAQANAVRVPRSWMLEGSQDGLNWDVLHAVVSNDLSNIVSGESHWFSNDNPALGMGFGPYASGDPSLPRPASVASVSAVEGATAESLGDLVADGIVYDCASGGGTVKGFTMSANSAVRIVNCTIPDLNSKAAFFPIDLSGCGGIEDTSGWSLSVNGRSLSPLRLRVAEDGITVTPLGCLLMLR